MKKISVFIIFFCSQLCFSGEIENRIIKELQLKLPNYSFDSVKKSSIPNLYQVTTGASIFYVTKDVKFIFDGNILESKFDKNKFRNEDAEETFHIVRTNPDVENLVENFDKPYNFSP